MASIHKEILIDAHHRYPLRWKTLWRIRVNVIFLTEAARALF